MSLHEQLSINSGFPNLLSGHHTSLRRFIGRGEERERAIEEKREEQARELHFQSRSIFPRPTPPTHSKDRQVAAVFCIVARRHHSCFSLSMRRRLTSHNMQRTLQSSHTVVGSLSSLCPLWNVCVCFKHEREEEIPCSRPTVIQAVS